MKWHDHKDVAELFEFVVSTETEPARKDCVTFWPHIPLPQERPVHTCTAQSSQSVFRESKALLESSSLFVTVVSQAIILLFGDCSELKVDHTRVQ